MKTILVIEDNTEIRENMVEILELAKYKVISAVNGKLGVEMALKQTPDLVICDIMMPELDGYGVLHLFNKDRKLSMVPFIFVTAKAGREDFRKGMQMGADDYITKPFTQIELLDAVEGRLAKSEVLRAEYAPTTEGVTNFLNLVRANGSNGQSLNVYEHFDYQKKQAIYKIDTKPRYLYFLVKGMVKTYKYNDDGKEFITKVCKAGDFFGYTALLEDTNYTDSAEVLEDTTVMLIPKEEFMNVMYTDMQVAKKFVSLLSQDLAAMEDDLVSLAYNSLRKRIASGLLKVYEKHKKSADDQPLIELSRDDLAHLVGTATESLVRGLSDFKSEKLIEIKNGKISVLNEAKLRNMLN